MKSGAGASFFILIWLLFFRTFSVIVVFFGGVGNIFFVFTLIFLTYPFFMDRDFY